MTVNIKEEDPRERNTYFYPKLGEKGLGSVVQMAFDAAVHCSDDFGPL